VRRSLAATLAIVLPVTTTGDDLLSGLARCATISDRGQRLACYDALASIRGRRVDAAWRNARWGMTPEQVLQAFPGEAVSMPQPVDLDGLQVFCGIPDFQIGTDRFGVTFLFKDKGLSEIRVSKSAKSHGEGIERYNTLLQMLTEKYGPPLITTQDNYHWDARWSTAAASIGLQRVAIDTGTGSYAYMTDSVAITYGPPGRDGSKL
jgi:hypothetical protein